MDSDSDQSNMEGPLEPAKSRADWGKSKYNYYFTDYVDKDYPSKLSAKEEKLASLEEAEALRIQRKLAATLENVVDNQVFEDDDQAQEADLLESISQLNSRLTGKTHDARSEKVNNEQSSEEMEDEDENDDGDDDDDDDDDDQEDEPSQTRERRPINMAIKRNRGLTPYKKKEYRNPRVKHKLKYKKAMTKRRRLVREARCELSRYSGESSGIKTSTIRSIKL